MREPPLRRGLFYWVGLDPENRYNPMLSMLLMYLAGRGPLSGGVYQEGLIIIVTIGCNDYNAQCPF
jgi:hypothetical protein